MPKYTVYITRKVLEDAHVTIEAESSTDAIKKVLALANNGEVEDWHYFDAIGGAMPKKVTEV